MTRKWFVSVFVVGALAVLSGCAPRGETKTLAEILTNAKTRYQSAMKNASAPDVSKSLADLSSRLEKISTAKDKESIASNSKEVADLLDGLVGHAGYTQRAPLGEVIKQYRVLGTGAAPSDPTQGAATLLVARTYTLLSSELETVKFGL